MRTYLILLTTLTIAIVPFPTARSRFVVPTIPQRATVLGYDRTLFGPGWATDGTGCDTRERIIARDLDDDPCTHPEHPPTPRTSHALDPYTGGALARNDIEVDHIIPVSAAWDLGAHRWDAAQRAKFYNDPLNLVAVSSAANQEKSDKLPSEWMPARRRARCAYGERMVVVAKQYALPLPEPDLRAIKRACSGLLGLSAYRHL